MLWLETCVLLCRDHCGQHQRCSQDKLVDYADIKELCRIFAFLAKMMGVLQVCYSTQKGLQVSKIFCCCINCNSLTSYLPCVFVILVFLCSGPVCESCLLAHVTVAVDTLCFCVISRFVFTVTMENEGGLLSPSYSWKYMVSPGKLMTETGNESIMQFWMSIPPPGESWGCRAQPCLFLT